MAVECSSADDEAGSETSWLPDVWAEHPTGERPAEVGSLASVAEDLDALLRGRTDGSMVADVDEPKPGEPGSWGCPQSASPWDIYRGAGGTSLGSGDTEEVQADMTGDFKW